MGLKRLGPAKDESPRSDEAAARVAAVRLLARREHSTGELKDKLVSGGHDAATVDQVVQGLRDKRLVSDTRFVSSFVHHRAMRGQGPVRIRAELRQHGIADADIQQELDRAEVDWNELATRVRLRKFGQAQPRSAAERAKQMRFLQYRGFSTEQIRAALTSSAAADADPELASDLD
jgi:regulatory protein